MKYMLVMRATDEAYASMANADFNEMLETVGKFNEELIRAGVLLAAEGLADAAEGVVVDFSSEPPVVTDGPYGETKELFGGFYILNVASKEEAVEWAKRLPIKGPGFKTEIRRVSHDRRVPAGQRVDQEGAGMARGHRPAVTGPALTGRHGAVRRAGGWLTPPAGRPSPPSGGSSPRGSSVRSPATPGTSRWPRTSPRRRSRRRW